MKPRKIKKKVIDFKEIGEHVIEKYFQVIFKETSNVIVCCVKCATKSEVLQAAYIFDLKTL